MSSGWIKLHRQLLEWEWYDDTNTKCLFLHCLLRANHNDTEWRGHKIKRGEFLTSVDTLTRETGLTVSQVRTSLKKLISTNEIASKSQARSTVITVIEYDSHQVDDKQVNKLMTMKSQADDNEIATDKNLRTKELKNVITKDIVTSVPKFNFKSELLALGVDNEILEDWLTVRKKKKAANTKTAFAGLMTEINKSGLSVPNAIKISAENSWSGFKADWYSNLSPTQKAKSTHTFETQDYQSGKF